MKYINYIESGVNVNERFKLDSNLNRDDSNYPYWLLRNCLLQYGYEINTPDINFGREIVLEIHLNVQPGDIPSNAVLILLETPQVWPLNGEVSKIQKYQMVFTWNDAFLGVKNFNKINFPNKYQALCNNTFKNRSNFCCMIATGGKGPAIESPLDLYAERIKTIKWFEKNYPKNFDLYGRGWEVSIVSKGFLTKILRKIWLLTFRAFGYKAFKSFRGPISSKFEILSRYKFNICYENVGLTNGYITEKIFDAFFSGCVPVYWGAPNITEFIPKGCFIDRRDFPSHEDLYAFLESITQEHYQKYQIAIQDFLLSDKAKLFYAEHFSSVLCNKIVEFASAKSGGVQ